jgi:hypothetical protein
LPWVLKYVAETSEEASSFYERLLMTEELKLGMTEDAIVNVFCLDLIMEAWEAPAAVKGRLLHQHGGSGRAWSSHELEVPEVR